MRWGPIPDDWLVGLLRELGLEAVHAARLARGYALAPVYYHMTARGRMSVRLTWRREIRRHGGWAVREVRDEASWDLTAGEYIRVLEELRRRFGHERRRAA